MEKTIRVGQVSSVNYEEGTVKVTYPNMDDVVTDDLPMATLFDTYKMPKVGACVLVVHLSNGMNAGICLDTYWHDDNRPPQSGEGLYRQDFGPEYGMAFLRYLKQMLDIICDGKITIRAKEQIVLDAPNVTTTGQNGGADTRMTAKTIRMESQAETTMQAASLSTTTGGATNMSAGSMDMQASGEAKLSGSNVTFTCSAGSITVEEIIAHIKG